MAAACAIGSPAAYSNTRHGHARGRRIETVTITPSIAQAAGSSGEETLKSAEAQMVWDRAECESALGKIGSVDV